MNFKQIGTEALDILQLKEPAIHAVAHDRSKLQSALLCIAIGALASSLGLMFFPVHTGLITYRPDIAWILGSAFGAALGQSLVLLLIGFLTERFFHSKLSAQGFLQVMGTASLVNVLGLVPGLGVIAALWSLVVTGKVLHSEGKMESGAIAAVLILILLIFGSVSYSQMGPYGMGLL